MAFSPTVEQIALGCSELVVTERSMSKVGWLTPETHPVLPYTTTVPTVGWFFPQAPEVDDRSPAPEAVLREMWQGGRVAWYAPDADAGVVAALDSLAGEHPEWRMRVAQWPDDREPLGGQVAFAAWGATQACEQPAASVAEGVWAAGTQVPGAPGEQPDPVDPKAVLPQAES